MQGLDLALAMGTFGFVVALGVFAFNIVEFRATRKDLASTHRDLVRHLTKHEERMTRLMTEHGEILRDIRDSLVASRTGKPLGRKRERT